MQCEQRTEVVMMCSEEKAHHELGGILLPDSGAQSPAADASRMQGRGGPNKATHCNTAAAHEAPEEGPDAAREPAGAQQKTGKGTKSRKRGIQARPGTARPALKEGRENEQRPSKRTKPSKPEPSPPNVHKQYKYVRLVADGSDTDVCLKSDSTSTCAAFID